VPSSASGVGRVTHGQFRRTYWRSADLLRTADVSKAENLDSQVVDTEKNRNNDDDPQLELEVADSKHDGNSDNEDAV